MLKKEIKKDIILKGIIIVMLLINTAFILADDKETDEFVIKPLYVFSNKGKRDPFKPRYKKEVIPVIDTVDISTLVLQGITETKQSKAALFKTMSGSDVSYIFINGKMYKENEEIISDVKGEIKNNKEVVLKQGDKEILFKLSDEVTGPDIRPEQ